MFTFFKRTLTEGVGELEVHLQTLPTPSYRTEDVVLRTRDPRREREVPRGQKLVLMWYPEGSPTVPDRYVSTRSSCLTPPGHLRCKSQV